MSPRLDQMSNAGDGAPAVFAGPLSPLASTRFALSLGVLSFAFAAGALMIWVAASLDTAPFHFDLVEKLVELPIPQLFAAVGLFIAIRLKGHPVGAALIIASLGYSGFTFLGAYAEYALSPGGPDLPGATLAATLYSMLWVVMLGGMTLLLLLFPGGLFPSTRWSHIATATWLFALLYFAVYPFLPVDLNPPFAHLQSPFAIDALRPFAWLPWVLPTPTELLTAAASLNLLLRFWRSRGVERQQFRLLGIAGIATVITTLLSATPLSVTAYGLQLLSFALIPIAVGVAILRYDLYGIDRVINRALVYAVLTLGLGALYFGLVIGLQRLLEQFSGGSDLAIIATTLAVAALFLPARRRVQRVVDRRFNRRAYDAERTIEAFNARLRESIELDALRAELLTVVDETMQPSGVAVWLRSDRRFAR
ncbi:MAG: hypothetical protein ACSLFM_01425 [Tepidiformaceae bacterium]